MGIGCERKREGRSQPAADSCHCHVRCVCNSHTHQTTSGRKAAADTKPNNPVSTRQQQQTAATRAVVCDQSTKCSSGREDRQQRQGARELNEVHPPTTNL